jgi:riboflavin synthase
MFTGIVSGTAKVSSLEKTESGCILTVDLEGFVEGLEIGASVSIDGVCLTVVSIEGALVRFDAIKETLERTTMGDKKIGDLVNVERSLKVGDELGGHILSGHVMSSAKIIERKEDGMGIELLVENPEICRPFILEKGYIAVDGMSLTVGEVSQSYFGLYIIPETMRVTSIGKKTVGDGVNIEVDSRTQAVVETMLRNGEKT